MCGVWVALEDVKPDSGELEVFPGTHRLPRVYIHGSGCEKVTDDDWADFGEKIVKRYRRMLDDGGFRSVTYRPKRGTVLVWHENLLHGGSVRRIRRLSRRSIVSHYSPTARSPSTTRTGLPGHMEVTRHPPCRSRLGANESANALTVNATRNLALAG